MSLVLDASVTMAWCFEADATPYTEQILGRHGELERSFADRRLVGAFAPRAESESRKSETQECEGAGFGGDYCNGCR